MIDTQTFKLTLIDFDQMSIGETRATVSTTKKVLMDDLKYARMMWTTILGYMTAPEETSEEQYVLEDVEKNPSSEYEQRKGLLQEIGVVQYEKRGRYQFIMEPTHEQMVSYFHNRDTLVHQLASFATTGGKQRRKHRSIKKKYKRNKRKHTRKHK